MKGKILLLEVVTGICIGLLICKYKEKANRRIQEVKTMKKIRNIFSKKNLKTIAKLPVLLGAIIVVEKVLEKCYTFLESSECDLWA